MAEYQTRRENEKDKLLSVWIGIDSPWREVKMSDRDSDVYWYKGCKPFNMVLEKTGNGFRITFNSCDEVLWTKTLTSENIESAKVMGNLAIAEFLVAGLNQLTKKL